jgi:benzylsuccinate CoA-transferase BbsF subunit
MADLPLSGYRVVDFGWVWAGAVPGHILADMGAEVIKIESRKRLDYMRKGRPIIGTKKDPEQNPMFHNVNRNKLSLTIDMKHPKGISLLEKLIAKSDVVIENYSPGVLDKLGLGYENIKKVNEKIVMIAMSAAGQYGPLKDIRTYATMIAGLSGMDSMVGYLSEKVLGMQQAYADPNASLHAAFALLVALWYRDRTGKGQYIDLSQWESGINVIGEAIMDHQINDKVPGTMGNRHSSYAPYGNYPCKEEDTWVSIAVSDDNEWRSLCTVMNRLDLIENELFNSPYERFINQVQLDSLIAEWTRTYTNYEVMDTLQQGGVAATPLLNAQDRYFDPFFKERGTYVEIEHPILGIEPIYGIPWKMENTSTEIRRHAPLLGEHNNYVFNELLGLSDEEMKVLMDEEIII